MNIWLISIFEQTPVDKVHSTRFINIADEALARGHKVTFFASTFKHNTKVQRYEETTEVEIRENYKMVFIKSAGYKKNISYQRILSHNSFSKSLINELNKREKPDMIYMAFPPISMDYEVSKWAVQNKIPVIMDIIDPWPDTFRNAMKKIPKFIQDLILRSMTLKLIKTLKQVNAVCAISNQYLDWAKGYYPEIKKTLCIYPAVKFIEMQQQLSSISQSVTKDKNKLRVIYAGSLASSYDIPAILNAAKILNKKYGNEIEIVIAGVGTQEELIHDSLKELSNLTYRGRLVKEDLMKEYFLCDLGLTQHVKGATQSVTYKLFDLLGCGLPILNSLESEMKEIILDNRVGMFNKPGDAETLAKNIEFFFLNKSVLEEYKKNALELTAKLGDAEIVYKRTVDLIENI